MWHIFKQKDLPDRTWMVHFKFSPHDMPTLTFPETLLPRILQQTWQHTTLSKKAFRRNVKCVLVALNNAQHNKKKSYASF